jgi:G3E family GTPase
VYALEAGNYTLELESGPDPAMSAALVRAQGPSANDLAQVVEPTVLIFSDEEQETMPGATLTPGNTLYALQLEQEPLRFTVDIAEAGHYALFTEHHPDEFGARLVGPAGQGVTPLATHEYKPDHEHDEAVTSVGITADGDVDPSKINDWLGRLLREQGPDIFRMKGVLSIKNQPQRFVFQGVHMLFDGRPDRDWGDEPRRNALIFIGRNLDRQALNAGFKACLV